MTLTLRAKNALKVLMGKPLPGPIATGTVGPGSNKPSGMYWDQLEAANTLAEVEVLADKFLAMGYGPEGQLMTATVQKMQSLLGG